MTKKSWERIREKLQRSMRKIKDMSTDLSLLIAATEKILHKKPDVHNPRVTLIWGEFSTDEMCRMMIREGHSSERVYLHIGCSTFWDGFNGEKTVAFCGFDKWLKDPQNN